MAKINQNTKLFLLLVFFTVVIRLNNCAGIMVDDFLNKRYKLESSENWDEFMKALGVGLVTRKVGNAVSPVAELKKSGDKYTLTSQSTFKNVEVNFVPGVEFDQETPDGRNVKSVITINGNTLHEVQKDPNSGKETVIDRTWTADEIKMVMTHDNITCTRIYKVLPN